MNSITGMLPLVCLVDVVLELVNHILYHSRVLLLCCWTWWGLRYVVLGFAVAVLGLMMVIVGFWWW